MSVDVRHTVRDGECVSSIAFAYGHFPDTLWDHPENAALRQARGNMNVLLAGDVVFVPAVRPREVDAATDRTHVFRRRGVPEKLRLRFHDAEGAPRADLPYRLEIDGAPPRTGRTGPDGELEAWVPPNAIAGVLTLGEGDDEESYELALGRLDPVTEVRGVQQRLRSLGYPFGSDAPGTLGDGTRGALRAFQRDHAMEVTGEPDEATRQALLDAYGG